jgi:heterodisulfide reductase subunit C
MNCGACTATCSAQQFTSFNIRKIKSLYQQAQYDKLAKELEKCMLCGKCTLVCPRGLNLRPIVMNMRKILNKK